MLYFFFFFFFQAEDGIRDYKVTGVQTCALPIFRDEHYHHQRWPDDYWPASDAKADAKAWKKTVAQFRKDRAALEKIAASSRVALGAPLPYAPKHTYIRELLIVSEHNTYHIGELAILRQVMGAWPAKR